MNLPSAKKHYKHLIAFFLALFIILPAANFTACASGTNSYSLPKEP